MATKLKKNVLPTGHSPNDFVCFGPAATKDGEFDSCKIADLGCFNQNGIDSNKYYHGAIVQSKINNGWYVYFEWGRTGSSDPDFQFVYCGTSESEAQSEFVKQLLAKNVKRGIWTTVAGIKVLKPKPNEKSCYVVRPMATRVTGLPDARTIKSNDVTGPVASPKLKHKSVDSHTLALIRDLKMATIAYTRGAMADASLPTLNAIDEARNILIEAEKRLMQIGDSLSIQQKDSKLYDYTTLLFGRIPKRKPINAPVDTWVLTQDNIISWRQDLDAFESAISSYSTINDVEVNPLADMKIEIEYMPKSSLMGDFIYNWMPKASNNSHGNVGGLHIKNVWQIKLTELERRFIDKMKQVNKVDPYETPRLKPTKHPYLSAQESISYANSHTALLWHGSRSVNVASILKTGLKLPKQLVGVTLTGSLLGGGAYFAEDWKKSAGYCSLQNSYWSNGDGKVKGREAFMFAVDVILGQPYTAAKSKGYTSPPAGYHSVLGKANVTGISGGGKLKNNEWVIYDTSQHFPRFLIEFSTK